MSAIKSRGTVNIDPEALRAVKIVAAEQGTTVKNIVEKALWAYFLRWPRTGMETSRTAHPRSEKGRRPQPTTSGSPRT
jgi:hypothetical protein